MAITAISVIIIRLLYRASSSAINLLEPLDERVICLNSQLNRCIVRPARANAEQELATNIPHCPCAAEIQWVWVLRWVFDYDASDFCDGFFSAVECWAPVLGTPRMWILALCCRAAALRPSAGQHNAQAFSDEA